MTKEIDINLRTVTIPLDEYEEIQSELKRLRIENKQKEIHVPCVYKSFEYLTVVIALTVLVLGILNIMRIF